MYVFCIQGISGIAKDLTKMSSKSAIKLLVPEKSHSILFKWVAILTGSKNALKGLGFFRRALAVYGWIQKVSIFDGRRLNVRVNDHPLGSS